MALPVFLGLFLLSPTLLVFDTSEMKLVFYLTRSKIRKNSYEARRFGPSPLYILVSIENYADTGIYFVRNENELHII